MPPIPKPRSAHLSYNEENINEQQQQSSIPPLSQSRVRRLKQKTTANINNETLETPISVVSVTNEDEEQETSAINNSFIAKIRENDTLARYKRELSSPGHGNQYDGIVFFFIFLCINEFFLDNNIARANASARQRRREQRVHSTTSPKEDNNNNHHPTTPPVYDRSISNDSQIDAVEQERKAKRDINDFLHQLDATLRLPVSALSTSIEIPSMCDRTMVSTSKLEERRDALKQTCLKEISPKELNQVLDILDRVSETEIKQRMIEILGEDIYEKYCAQIYSLKFYESSLFTRQ